MSTKGSIYKEITGHLMHSVEGLAHAAKNRGQLDDTSNYMFPRPAVFISYGNVQYEKQADGTQIGDGILKVRTAYENYSESFSGSIDEDKAIAFFDFNEKVHQALEGLHGTYFKNLSRINDEDDEDHKNIIVTYFEYAITILDKSTAHLKGYQKLAVDPNIIVDARLQKKTDKSVDSSVLEYLPIIPNQ